MKTDEHGNRYMTRTDVQNHIEEYCQDALKVSSVEALRMLDAGELHGTMAADYLKGMRLLLETAKE